MKPKEKKPETVFRIINRETGGAEGSYSRACCTEYDFKSLEEARSANFHGMFEDESKYQIGEYRVTYTLIEPDVQEDPESKERRIAHFASTSGYYAGKSREDSKP